MMINRLNAMMTKAGVRAVQGLSARERGKDRHRFVTKIQRLEHSVPTVPLFRL